MSPRSIRRAMERKSKKLAFKQQRLQNAPSQEEFSSPEPATDTSGSHLSFGAEPESSSFPDGGVSPASSSLDSLASLGFSPCPSACSSDTVLPRPAAPADSPLLHTVASSPSSARLRANRENAQHSTGPRTAAGKSKVSLNAVKTGLTGRTVLLPSDDAAAYQHHVEQYRSEFHPSGLRETELVQSLADISWRKQRIPGLEMAIYALGRLEFESAAAEHNESVRPGFIELKTFFKYEKQLRNLQLQESRLARRYISELAELRALQKERIQREMRRAEATAKSPRPAQPPATPAKNNELGFEFSTAAGSQSSPVQADETDRVCPAAA